MGAYQVRVWIFFPSTRVDLPPRLAAPIRSPRSRRNAPLPSHTAPHLAPLVVAPPLDPFLPLYAQSSSTTTTTLAMQSTKDPTDPSPLHLTLDPQWMRSSWYSESRNVHDVLECSARC